MPRPKAPLSGSRISVRRPTLRWSLPPSLLMARVEMCVTRACSAPVQAFDGVGGSMTLATTLSPGVHYWRLRALVGGVPGDDASPVWQFTTPTTDALRESVWPGAPDVDGDGYADVIVGEVDQLVLFRGGAAGLTRAAVTIVAPDGPGGGFGRALASAGDVDGDGFGDVVVGAPLFRSRTGAVYVYRGGPSGLGGTPWARFDGYDGPGADFGISVAGAGDLDGDGYADFLVGAPSGAWGYAYEFLGGRAIAPTSTIGLSVFPAGRFGAAIAAGGDFDLDGFADAVFALPDAYGGTGMLDVRLGGPAGLLGSAMMITPFDPGLHLGRSLAIAGDVNGDGRADVVAGAPGDPGSDGVAYVFTPISIGAGPPYFAPSHAMHGAPGSGMRLGTAVAGGGDIDGDGHSDVLAGGDFSSGGVVVVAFDAAHMTSAADVALGAPGRAGERFGASLGAPGDVNGDGFDDVIAGAPASLGAGPGSVNVFLGRVPRGWAAPDVVLLPAGGDDGFAARLAL